MKCIPVLNSGGHREFACNEKQEVRETKASHFFAIFLISCRGDFVLIQSRTQWMNDKLTI